MSEALLDKIVRRLTRKSLPRDKFCPICNQAVDRFSPYRGGWAEAPALMRTLCVVGSDLDNWACPSCNSHDRERHLYLYLKRLHLLDRFAGAAVLHFAPEKRLSRLLAQLKTARYVKADLFPSADDIQKVDMLNICFPDESFDIVLANHVLEHVGDDRRGTEEIRRVLRPGGFAILQTPYSERLHATWEDPGIDDDEARNAIYGQEDHARLFGRDIFDRFAQCGLVADIRRHDDVLADFDPVKFGLNKQEPLFLYHRA